MENPIKMEDLGVPLFWKHPYVIYLYFFQAKGGLLACVLTVHDFPPSGMIKGLISYDIQKMHDIN